MVTDKVLEVVVFVLERMGNLLLRDKARRGSRSIGGEMKDRNT